MKEEKTTRDYSSQQESDIARLLLGRVQSNSGGTKFGGGDVLTSKFFVEAKTVMSPKKSFSVKSDWLKKAQEQMFEQGKEKWALAFRFEPDGEDYFVISGREMKEYVNFVEFESYWRATLRQGGGEKAGF